MVASGKLTGGQIIEHYLKGKRSDYNGLCPGLGLGLMSGTSMDGIDVLLIETDGKNVFSLGPACTVPYTPKLEQLIRDALGDQAKQPRLIRDITDAHAVAVSTILSQHPEFKNKITMVGLHGHTVAHSP